jgi:hypothetical protein
MTETCVSTTYRFGMARRLVSGAAAPVLAAALLFVSMPVAGQETGRITGRVVDAQTGAGIANVTVEVVAAGVGTLSGVDGRYVIDAVPAGLAAVRAQSIGYGTKTVTSVTVRAGTVVEQNLTLDPAALELMAIEVTAAAERGSVSRALDGTCCGWLLRGCCAAAALCHRVLLRLPLFPGSPARARARRAGRRPVGSDAPKRCGEVPQEAV